MRPYNASCSQLLHIRHGKNTCISKLEKTKLTRQIQSFIGRKTMGLQLRAALNTGANAVMPTFDRPRRFGASQGPICLGDSVIDGKGVFMTVDIEPNQPLFCIRGELKKSTETQTFEEDKYTWASPDSRFIISQYDVAMSNFGRFLNSSQGTSSMATAVIHWFCGGKVAVVYSGPCGIKAGIELTIDYKLCNRPALYRYNMRH